MTDAQLRPLLEMRHLINQPDVVEGLSKLDNKLEEALVLVDNCERNGKIGSLIQDVRASFEKCEKQITILMTCLILPILRLHLESQNKTIVSVPTLTSPPASALPNVVRLDQVAQAPQITSMSCLANSLAIVWGSTDDRYWNWRTVQDSRSVQVAYVREVFWLEVTGQMRCHLLPGLYSLSWRLQLDKAGMVSGWDSHPVLFDFQTSDGQHAQREFYLTSAGTQDCTVQKGWTLYDVGQFKVSPDNQGLLDVNFSMKELNGLWKRGLFIDAVVVHAAHASSQSGSADDTSHSGHSSPTCRLLCEQSFPEVKRFVYATEANFGSTQGNMQIGDGKQMEDRIFEIFLGELRGEPFPGSCITKGLMASSEGSSSEKIENTLCLSPDKYWRSEGQRRVDVKENLTYQLKSRLCVVHEVKVQPYRDIRQDAVYAAKQVRIRLGGPRKGTDTDIHWNYKSPKFAMKKEDSLQSFKLERPVLCIGGLLQIELLGRVHKQTTLSYICIRYVEVIGTPLLNFDFQYIPRSEQCTLSHNPP